MKIGNRKYLKVIVILALFNCVFLGTEYLFDGMMAYVTDSSRVVIAQSYILGASVIGFLLFPVMNRYLKTSINNIVMFAMALASVICIFVMQQHLSYETILIVGCIAFVLFGVIGSAVHYRAACLLSESRNLAKTVGIAYGVGVFLQFLNNNLVKHAVVEAVVLAILVTVLVILLVKMNLDVNPEEEKVINRDERAPKNAMVAGATLLIVVALMTCIFASLDNAVTLVHAAGSADIGQWPRLLLALSGVTAGFLFDLKNRRFMHIMMYCVTLLSTVCVVVLEFGGSFWTGLTVFYLSAGCFAVYFTAGFMDLSYHMPLPELWAGLGRAVNNLCAVITGTVFVTLLTSQKDRTIMILALILFALISVTLSVYADQFRKAETISDTDKNGEAEEKFLEFAKAFSLTDREKDVLKVLLTTDDSVQETADKLYISRAALYRYIGNLNEKTETKSRIGLLQFYYAWKNVD